MGVVVARFRYTTHDHVAVSDGFDFFQAVRIGESVESREEVVQEVDQGFGGDLVRQGGETNKVREQDRDAGVALSDVAFTLLEPSGDGFREDIQEEPLGLFLLDFEQVFFLLQLEQSESLEIAQAFPFERSSHPRLEENRTRRFGKEIFGPELNAAYHGLKGVDPGCDDHRDVVLKPLIAQGFEDSKSVQPRHLDVQHQQVEIPLAEHFNGLLPVPRFGDILVPQGPEHEHHQIAQLIRIFHHQDGRVLARDVGLGELQLGQLLRRKSLAALLLEETGSTHVVVSGRHA